MDDKDYIKRSKLYKPVKQTSEDLLKKIIIYVNESGLSDDEISSLLLELSASLMTSSAISQTGLQKDLDCYVKNMKWFDYSCLSAIVGFYKGSIDYEVLKND